MTQPITRKPRTWGDIYNAALRRGYDHGYAAWLADQWERLKLGKDDKHDTTNNESAGAGTGDERNIQRND